MSMPAPSLREYFSIARLAGYSPLAQQYGEWFSGFPWQIWGCGTYSGPHTEQHADASFKCFVGGLRRKIKVPVAYIAVRERTYSGLGKSETRMHWHFVMSAIGDSRVPLISKVASSWRKLHGDVDVHPYNHNRSGAFYLAKTADRDDWHYLTGHLERMNNRSSSDILQTIANNLYVPGHLRSAVSGSHLRIRSHSGEWRAGDAQS